MNPRLLALLVLAAAAPGAVTGWSPRAGTLSMDPQGWAFSPSLAAAGDGTLYAVWTQHRKADVWEEVSPRAAVWSGGAWQPLGGRIEAPGHEGYDPQIVVLGATPYIAWYSGQGYGWGTVGSTFYPGGIFVAHWSGSDWLVDANADQGNGSLTTAPTFHLGADWPIFARNPRLAVIGGRLYAAWVESRPGDYGANGCNVIVVKHLDAGTWVLDGAPFNAVATGGSKITDLALAGVGGVPHVAWSEYARTSTGSGEVDAPATAQVVRLAGGTWTAVGGALNLAGDTHAGYVALAAIGATPYVAWQERAVAGPNRLHAKHWTGAVWSEDGGTLNVDATTGEAGRPNLTSDGGKLWLAWTESAPGVPAQLYVRSLAGGAWSPPEGSLARDPVAGSVERPGLAIAGGVPQLIWAEHDAATRTKQVYVSGRDAAGVAGGPALSSFGSDGAAPTIPDNTWVALHPGGVAKAAWGIGDEGYDSFAYDPGIRRAVCYGLYHSMAVSWGENQNALLGYDFARNRWDLLEAGELAWSENLPGVGHDEGNATIDPVHDIYLTHGNLSVGSETRYTFYAYDLKARRGKRLTPPVDLPGPRVDLMACAFDPEHDLALYVSGSAWLYDRAANTWSAVANSPAPRTTASLVWDSRDHLFVMYGGGLNGYATPYSNETWTFEPVTRAWTRKAPAQTPPAYPYPTYPYMAYDSAHGISLLIGGGSSEAWAYDAAADTWTRLADLPAGAPISGTDGAYLTYDADDDVFLVRGAADIADLWAFRYAPAGGGTTTGGTTTGGTTTGGTTTGGTTTGGTTTGGTTTGGTTTGGTTTSGSGGGGRHGGGCGVGGGLAAAVGLALALRRRRS